MKNYPVKRTILEPQSEDSYIASHDPKKLEDKDPWLFYGEDEDFINAA